VLILLLRGLFAATKSQQESRVVWWVLGIYSLLVLVAFVQFNLIYVQPQARYIFPAIGPIAVWIAFGVRRVAQGRAKVLGGLILAALLFANVYALSILPREFRKRESQALTGQLRLRDPLLSGRKPFNVLGNHIELNVYRAAGKKPA